MKYQAYYKSPIGLLEISASEKGISRIRICERKVKNAEMKSSALIEQCIAQLNEYFTGERKVFDLNLDFGNSPNFYREVWKTIQIIPYGKTRSYSAIAKRLGNPKAVRAVGMANGKNPLPIVVPCHRVIGKNGDLGGYAYGLSIKSQLLRLENPLKFSEQGVLF